MATLNWTEDMKPAVPGTAYSPFTMTDRPVGDFVNKSITKYTNSLTTYDTKSVSILAATTENQEGVDCDDPMASSTNPLNTGKKNRIVLDWLYLYKLLPLNFCDHFIDFHSNKRNK
mgnify:CR=1 FL=1